MFKNTYLHIAYFLCAISLISCTETKKKDYTFFGGKIVNPKSNFVYITNYQDFSDSIYLDKSNSFKKTYRNLKEGLYYFKHGHEFQYVYFSENDSVLLRLNTWNFDETLTFSGANAERNNELIKSFLESEKDNKFVYKFYESNSFLFSAVLDSMINVKNNQIETYKIENPKVSENFLHILEITKKYPLYSKIERYPMVHKNKMQIQSFPNLKNSFFDFRKNINLNNDNLIFYDPYYNYVVNRLYSEAYQSGIKSGTNEFTVNLLETIGKNISSKSIKNDLLNRVIVNHFYRKSTCNINKEAFNVFFKLSTDEDNNALIKKLYQDATKLHKEDKLLSFYVNDYSNSKKNIIHKIKNKNCVLFFKNATYSSDDWIASRINFLTKKYPRLTFYIIDIDDTTKKHINRLDIKNQFYLPKTSTAHNFLQSKYTRTVLVDKKGVIVNGFASLSSPKIIKQLEDLSKK